MIAHSLRTRSRRAIRIGIHCMGKPILNVELVESLQRAALRGKSLTLLDEVGSPTLAGLLEYGCLRHQFPDAFPEAPGAIAVSGLGRELGRLATPLGVRSGGERKPEVRSINVRTAEFHDLPCAEASAADPQWALFLSRFHRSAVAAGFSNGAADKLLSAFAEMAENAVIHADSPVAPIAGYQTIKGVVKFSVVDVGLGVRQTLATNPMHADLSDDLDAIRRALRSGVSCRPEGGGFGFGSVFKALAEQWGTLRFRSGNGGISMDGTSVDADQCVQTRPPPLHGFQVSVCCRLECPGEEVSPF